MAVVKTISANGSKGHHKFSLRVSEDSTSGNSSFMSYSLTIAPIQSGWDWNASGVNYSITIGSNTYTGPIYSYNGSSTTTIKSGSNIEIPHNTDGTKTINVGFSITDSTTFNFTPGNASASDTMTLTSLHKAPTINTATMTETNSLMISLGVPNTTIVPYLSQKTITLDVTPYDSATLSYRIRHGFSNYALPSATTYQASNVFNTDYRTNEIEVSNGKVGIVQYVLDSKGSTNSGLVLVDIDGTAQQPRGIPYAKPTLEETSTHVKRKSGNGTNLTDNKANVNVKGLIYKGADVVGNYNSTTQVGYKIWQSGASEPVSYTNLTATTDSSGNVTVTNFEISNVDFTKAYNYKIILKDNYNYTYIVEGTIPLGQPTWSEYKDRVDFLNITKQNLELYPNIYSTSEEIVVGKWIDDKPIYRKVLTGTTGSSAGDVSITHNIANLDKFIKIEGFTDETDERFMPNFYRDFNSQYALVVYRANTTGILVSYGSSRTNKDFYLICEYTKTSD